MPDSSTTEPCAPASPIATPPIVRWHVTWRWSHRDLTIWLATVAAAVCIAACLSEGWVLAAAGVGVAQGFLWTLYAFVTGHFVMEEVDDHMARALERAHWWNAGARFERHATLRCSLPASHRGPCVPEAQS